MSSLGWCGRSYMVLEMSRFGSLGGKGIIRTLFAKTEGLTRG